jgi:hypothetical protein
MHRNNVITRTDLFGWDLRYPSKLIGTGIKNPSWLIGGYKYGTDLIVTYEPGYLLDKSGPVKSL